MNRYKICVYAISKNEEQFVDRWMDAVSEADEVIVTDTGSTDGTVEKLRARGGRLYMRKPFPHGDLTQRETLLLIMCLKMQISAYPMI
ncbi:glycosyltransferase [Lacrimispora xylanisolvens]|uniref:glycosyltransferase n=1 Tax=Lacrimispora xylanisolvens TaxID=384636 RepID=UPI0032E7F6D9